MLTASLRQIEPEYLRSHTFDYFLFFYSRNNTISINSELIRVSSKCQRENTPAVTIGIDGKFQEMNTVREQTTSSITFSLNEFDFIVVIISS